MHRLFDVLVDEALYEARRQRQVAEEELHAPARRERSIEQEVKMMYARGDIGSGTYHRLLEMARSGDLGRDDLARAREEAGTPTGKRRPRERSAEIVRELNKLYRHRERLEEAEAESQDVLERLQAEARRRREQVETATERAREALPDEDAARRYLETRQEAEERLATLEKRIAELDQNLQRIGRLRDELEMREAELKALESGEQLAELEADIREELLD